MLSRLFGSGSTVAQLKAGLDASSRAVRGIANRVANAGDATFAQALQNAQGTAASGNAPVDIQKEMVDLADEQVRFQTTASLLQKTYQQIRSSVREQ